jgi:hypothetical protein
LTCLLRRACAFELDGVLTQTAHRGPARRVRTADDTRRELIRGIGSISAFSYDPP